jgi:hypothetical protein
MKTKKVNIMENPALSYFSEPEPIATIPVEAVQTTEAPNKTAPRHIPPRLTEARSKRLQCLIQPSLYARIKALADSRGVSVNDFIHTALEEVAKGEGI